MRHDPAGAAIVVMLRGLKMFGMAQAAGELMEQGAPAFNSAVPILSQLLKAETAEREVRSVAYQLKAARFPVYKDLSGFDFASSEVNEALVRQLYRCEFIENADNVVLVGGPGTGKTHIATALGVQAVEHHRKKVRFFGTVDLVNALEQEKTQGRSGQIAKEIEAKRRAFLRKWRLKCRAVAQSLEEAGDRLFTFTRLPESQWKSARTTNAIERLHEEFRRRIKTQTVLPSAETAAMLFWALLASGQITMRKVDGWQTLPEKLIPPCIDLAA